MKTKVSCVIILILSLISCGDKTNESKMSSDNLTDEFGSKWVDRYDKIEAKEIPDNIIQLISEDWMLVTAGNKTFYNTMTASWGGIGYIWEKPVSFMFIRDIRYTYEFLEKEDGFTLSFFTEENRGALRIAGTKSGRDTDKIKEIGLTPIETPSGLMSFGEARLIIECKKIFVAPLDSESFVENYKTKLLEDFYTAEVATHTLFISEITNVWMKK